MLLAGRRGRASRARPRSASITTSTIATSSSSRRRGARVRALPRAQGGHARRQARPRRVLRRVSRRAAGRAGARREARARRPRRRCARPATPRRSSPRRTPASCRCPTRRTRSIADFGIALGHKQHAAVACTQCHTPSREEAGAARALRRLPRRQGRRTAMTTCDGCHPPAVGKPQPPELAAVHDTVTSDVLARARTRRAAARQGLRDCATPRSRRPTTRELPRPTCKRLRAAATTASRRSRRPRVHAAATTASPSASRSRAPRRGSATTARTPTPSQRSRAARAIRSSPQRRVTVAGHARVRGVPRRRLRRAPAEDLRRVPQRDRAVARARSPTARCPSAPSSARRSITASTRGDCTSCHVLRTHDDAAAPAARPRRVHAGATQ